MTRMPIYLRQVLILVVLILLPELAYTDHVYACDSKIFCKGTLLDIIQMAGLYNDSKTFVDMNLKNTPATVKAAFNSIVVNDTAARSDIQEFMKKNFEGPGNEFEPWTPGDYVESPEFLKSVEDTKLRDFGKSLCAMWEQLGKKIKQVVRNKQHRYSLLYVDKPFIVPGGRFRETNYWDSLWVVHGLLRCEMTETVKGMLENFLSIIDRLGFVPSGFRIYYKERSHPPVFSWMVDIYYQATKDNNTLQKSLARLEKEYDFWMTNRSREIEKDGVTYTLNQYSTPQNEPMPESYSEEIEKLGAGATEDQAHNIFSNLASAAESGWDYSSRWFSREAGTKLEVKTTAIKDIIPVDLNSILCKNEKLLATFYNITGNSAKYRQYTEKYEARKEAIQKLLWNPTRGVWLDYYIPTNSQRDYFFPSNVFPMYAGCYGVSDMGMSEIEDKVLKYLQAQKIDSYKGGIPTSMENTGQQWDFPNAWAPLQHAVIMSLAEGQHDQSKAMARKLAQTWVYTNWLGWSNTKNMFEKYDVNNVGRGGGGGDFGVQTGFGLTNGVVLDLLSRYGATLTTTVETSSAATPTPVVVSVFLCGISLLLYFTHKHCDVVSPFTIGEQLS